KSAEALETLEKVDTVVIDKTGTLTEGRPRLVALVPAAGVADERALALAAGLERGSEHPLAAAVLAGAAARGVAPEAIEQFASGPGGGGPGVAGGGRVPLGNARLLAAGGGAPGPLGARADELRREGQTVVYLVVDGAVAALLGVADPIKASTAEAIRLLHAE